MSEVKKSKMGIVNKILAVLGLGDAGKFESFFGRIIKDLKKSIVTHQKNIENLKFNSDNVITELKEDLEDAEEELANAYLDVKVEDIANNEMQKSFADTYMNRIESRQRTLDSIKEAIKLEKDNLKDAIDGREESIKNCKNKIKNIESI